MLKKLAYSFVLASALVGTTVAPSFAGDDSMFKSICLFPVKVVGSCAGGVVGVPMGAFKDSVIGAHMGTKTVADALGKSGGTVNTAVGAVTGGPVGLVGGGAYGCFDGSVHGFKAGYSKPFSGDSFRYKDK